MNETVGSMELRLKKGVEVATLCAYYGGLLTPKQRDALRLHYEEDLSLGEIAEELNVTRQNVHELITRSGEKLLRYEQLLGCAARARSLSERLTEALTALDAAPGTSEAVERARQIITEIIHQQEGEDDEHGI